MNYLTEPLTQDELKKILKYDPETGEFTWLIAVSRNIKVGGAAGTKDINGYRLITLKSIQYKAHRLAFLYMTGKFPAEFTDHINGVRDDNRWSNIRAVSRSENQKNQKARENTTSGMIGVTRRPNSPSWKVVMRNNGKILTSYFTDSKFGSTNLSLMAACFHAVNKRKECGYHANHGRAET